MCTGRRFQDNECRVVTPPKGQGFSAKGVLTIYKGIPFALLARWSTMRYLHDHFRCHQASTPTQDDCHSTVSLLRMLPLFSQGHSLEVLFAGPPIPSYTLPTLQTRCSRRSSDDEVSPISTYGTLA
ncbi:hypothetical protein DPMN_151707 [Dreissena polymorpha]|uniref:Uncharacterized protein n=1 Tax=Dreissena polymorpha TaxID=45954 RepID=A0A9D4FH05_DREPO|nr:hypothetical protein DPMN_151707 [Dreissena polymorpha]